MRFFTLLLAIVVIPTWAGRPITLDEAIARARGASVDAAVALNELKASYWQWRTYRAQNLPEINFSATIPSYQKAYTTYQQSDGSYTFLRSDFLDIYGQISVDQNIPLTGGSLSLTTSLDFLRTLSPGTSTRYMTVPVALKLTQPIFGINTFKWDNRIEPVRYREAQAQFLEATEEVAMTCIKYYFALLLAQVDEEVAQQNLDNAKRLYDVALAKREMGKISKNDLLQMELNHLDARAALTSAVSTRKSAMFQLATFLDLADEELEPSVPALLPSITVNYAEAQALATERNALALNLRRRQLQADYDVATAKGNLRSVSLFAQVGLTGTNSTPSLAYGHLKDNQVVEVGVSIPLVDWGKRRGKVKVAQSNREVILNQLRQERQTFDQDLFILVERFNNQREQVEIAVAADTIAMRRYLTNVATYSLGRISTLDLNDSQVSKDEARSAYINQLYLYWLYYYQLRSLTLWDFALNRGIGADFDSLVK
ncbi:MAG: TolC family protein [Bacteroidales bacterium]|nr:TolC family protein [Bacteroidales bacterium]